ncbi:MAG: acyltransferase family protein [Alphaproteobacteria bacterium]
MTDLFVRPPGNFAALDGMRAIAVLLVLVFHCGLWGGALTFAPQGAARRLLEGCRMGVDVFFVLSGFLIGRMLLCDLVRDGWLHWSRFFVRRSFRIFPAYWLVLGTMLALGAGGMGAAWFYLFGTTDPAVLRSLAWENVAYLNNYLQPSGGVTVMSWAWSLCVEEHFYLLLPPLLWAIFRATRRLRLPLLVACTLVPVALRGLQHALDPSILPVDGFYFRSHNRFDQLFVGVLVAYLEIVHPGGMSDWARRFRHVLWPVGLALVALAWGRGAISEGGAFPVVWQYAVMATGVALVMVNALHLPNALTRFLSVRAWYPVARVSYGMYLVHPFVIFAIVSSSLRLRMIPPGVPGFIVLCVTVFVVAMLLASLLYLLVEKPFLDLGARLASRVDARAVARRVRA